MEMTCNISIAECDSLALPMTVHTSLHRESVWEGGHVSTCQVCPDVASSSH